MLPPPCECCFDCTIFDDDYSVDNLATDYDTRSGTWTVTGGEVQTASANALLVTNDSYASETACYAIAVLQCISTGDAGRVVILYVDDDNYWFAEVQPGATNGTLKLFERASGTNTQRGSTVTMTGLTAGTSVVVRICYAAGAVAAQAGVAASPLKSTHFNSVETVAGTQTGIGTGAVGTRVDFTSFEMSRHGYETEDCPACGTDCAHCAEGSMPDLEVAVTMSGLVPTGNFVHCGVGANCGLFNGVTFIFPVSAKSGDCFYTMTIFDDTSHPSCTGALVTLVYQVTNFAGTYQIFVSWSGELCTEQYSYDNGATKPDCSQIDLTIPNTFTGSASCDGSSSFAHIVV